ncbi:hypothetical protein [uncultured Parolsenella sp.]|nr:hypothetical protein [uncultured Parolsenella sp.]
MNPLVPFGALLALFGSVSGSALAFLAGASLEALGLGYWLGREGL